MKKAFITGITGQDGSYLAELLLKKGYEVHGIIRRSSSFNTGRLDSLYTDPHESTNLKLYHGDLTDYESMYRIIYELAPDEVYNLAAQSHVGVSFKQPIYTNMVNTTGTLNVLEAVRNVVKYKNKDIKYYQASSSEMFGNSDPKQNEDTRFDPRSPYACSKVYGFYQTVDYRKSYDMFACNGILFNHESERRGETFVTRKITMAAARIKQGLQQNLFLGNLSAKRDWGYAPDYVEAMWLMLQQDEPSDYVISTGISYSVQQFLEMVFAHLNLDWNKYVRIDEKYFRPNEVNYLEGDNSKAMKELNWTPKTDIYKMVTIMCNHDMKLAEKELILKNQNGV